VQQIVVTPCAVTDPIGWPPSGAQLPPVGEVVNSTLWIALADVHALCGRGDSVGPGFALQLWLPQVRTCAPELQSTPDGDPHVHGEHPRVSLTPPL
jgi:hypothetical protein